MKNQIEILKERVNVLFYGNKTSLLTLKEEMGKNQEQEELHYTAVFIEDPAEIKKLEKIADHAIKTLMPKNSIDNTIWHLPPDYHMTVKLGKLALSRKMTSSPDTNAEIDLKVTHLGCDNSAIALGVEGYMSKNERQHITLAFKTAPSDSNRIKNWAKLKNPLVIKGVIRET